MCTTKYALIQRLNRVFIGTPYMATHIIITHAHKLLLLCLVNQRCVLYKSLVGMRLDQQHLRPHQDPNHPRLLFVRSQNVTMKNSLTPFWETLQYVKDLF